MKKPEKIVNNEKEGENGLLKGFDVEKHIENLKIMSKSLKEEQDRLDEQREVLKEDKSDAAEEKAEQIHLESIRLQYSIIFRSMFRFINPVFQHYRITPLSDEEIDKLGTAIMNVSESKLKTTVQKIEQRFNALTKLPHYIDLLSLLWEICIPRISEVRALQKAMSG